MIERNNYLVAGLAGDINPVGVLGLEPDPLIFFLAEERVDVLRPEVVGVLLGILDGVASSTKKENYYA